MRCFLLALAMMFAGCQGMVLDPPGDVPAGDGAPVPNPRDPSDTLPTFEPRETALRRLTVLQYDNTIRDLLGADVDVANELDPDPVAEEGFEFSDVLATDVTTSILSVEKYDTASRAAARQVFADPERREALVGCVPADGADPCVGAFLGTFLRRAWRSPPEEEDLARYQALVQVGEGELGSVWLGLQYAVATALQSPFFLYRVEIGSEGPDGVRRFDDWEMASRLSFFLWDSTPDDELLNAASRAELTTEAGLRAQAERLLASPRAREPTLRFFREWLGLRGLDRMAKSTGAFPAFTDTLGPAMRREIELLLESHVLDADGSVLELLTTDETWVNAELAQLYDMDVPELAGAADDFVRVTLPPERRGLLTLGGMAALYAQPIDTSPTQRGLFVRNRILCEEIPPPPPGVETTLPMPMPGETLTNRQRVERHMSDPVCSGCHSKMDPLGLPLEHFDGIGAWRENDRGMELDVSGDLDGTTFDGAIELGEVLRADPRVRDCVVRQMYRHATGHHEEDAQLVAVYELSDRFAESGFVLRELVLELVSSEAFRLAGEPR